MTKMMKVAALGTTVAIAAACQFAFSQDDLDALLKDLDGDTAKKPAAAEVKAEEAKAEEPKAE